MEDLTVPYVKRFMIKLEQTLDSELDPHKRCKRYPNEEFSTYNNCDENYIYTYFMKLGLMPFWAAKQLEEITQLREDFNDWTLKVNY